MESDDFRVGVTSARGRATGGGSSLKVECYRVRDKSHSLSGYLGNLTVNPRLEIYDCSDRAIILLGVGSTW